MLAGNVQSEAPVKSPRWGLLWMEEMLHHFCKAGLWQGILFSTLLGPHFVPLNPKPQTPNLKP